LLPAKGAQDYSDYVHAQAAKFKKVNPNLKISAQVSIPYGSLSGMTLLETMEKCVDSVMDVADGAIVTI
jgi:hypothetical protein